MIKFLTQKKRKGYLWKTSQNLKILRGLASDESESMTIREGKVRETYELDLQKTQASVKLCLKRTKSVSK